jgi:hypothetical protein
VLGIAIDSPGSRFQSHANYRSPSPKRAGRNLSEAKKVIITSFPFYSKANFSICVDIESGSAVEKRFRHDREPKVHGVKMQAVLIIRIGELSESKMGLGERVYLSQNSLSS